MNVIKIFKPLYKSCLVFGFTTACQYYVFRLNMIVQVIIPNQEGLKYIGQKMNVDVYQYGLNIYKYIQNIEILHSDKLI